MEVTKTDITEEKAVCYCMTRNIYYKIWPSLNSLLEHNSIDRVYLIIEDDDVGFTLPDNVVCINMSNQEFFSKDSPNYHSQWTYMVMMRTVLSKVFPDLHRILSLDLDTIIEQDITELWDIPLDDYYLAAVKEPQKSRDHIYINCGVVMWNLDKLRDGKTDEIINALNKNYYGCCEQDCVNELCRGHILTLPKMYNASPYTNPWDEPYEGENGSWKIKHFAAEKAWWEVEPLAQRYKHPHS